MARINIIGAGTPTPTLDRFGSAFVVEAAGEQIMIDCGPAATYKMVRAGLWPPDIDYLFFTHHHFDHDVDYPCFLLTRWDQGIDKANELQVFGPAPTERLTEGILSEDGLWNHDWKSRVRHPVGQKVYENRGGTPPRKPPTAAATDVTPGKVFSAKDWEITAATAEHVQPYMDSLAYRLETPDGAIVFTGDTRPCESVQELARGADVLLCMCWGDQEVVDAAGEGPAVCGTLDAARMAQEAEVEKLVLIHVGADITGPVAMEKAVGDIKQVYDGDLVFSRELMTIEV